MTYPALEAGFLGKDEQGLGGSRSPLRCQPSRRG
jgi:hypothetical protein